MAIDRLSYEDAAAIPDVPLGTMESPVIRARHALMTFLEDAISSATFRVSPSSVKYHRRMALLVRYFDDPRPGGWVQADILRE